MKANDAAAMARDKAMISMMFFAALRESEVVNIRSNEAWVEQIATEEKKQSEEVLFVFISKSKTDQSGIGDTVVIDGKSGDATCPITAFKAFSTQRDQQCEYLFYNTRTRKKLSNTTPNFVIKNTLKRAGIDEEGFTSHGARRGLATEAFKKQVDIILLKRHGRWKSDAVYRYIDTDSIESRLSVTRAVHA